MSVQAARETEPLLAPKKDRRQLSCCCKLSYKPRKFSSKGAVLVLVWLFLIVSGYPSLTFLYSGTVETIFSNLSPVIVVFACIAVGWLADVRVGRLRVVKAGLLLMWLGVLLLGIFETVSIFLSEQNGRYVRALAFIGVFSASFGVAIFVTNAMQFGLEQMPDASSEAITAFLSWFFTVILSGALLNKFIAYLLPSHCLTIFTNQAVVYSINFALLSIAMCSMFLFSHWLIDHRQNRNPLKTVYRVLKFAKQHKYPVNRSAFTYCEDEIPSRIDLGKSKYGGPFTTEEVEDVKTFFRILAVLTTMLLVASAVIGVMTLAGLYLKKADSSCKVNMRYSSYVSVFLVPVIYEALVYPFVKLRCAFTTLKRIGALLLCTLLMSLVFLCLDLVSRFGGIDIENFFINHFELQIIIFIGIVSQLYIFLTALLEFVQSQSPENMKGFLFGILFLGLVATSSVTTGFLVKLPKKLENNFKTDSNHDIYTSTAVTVFTLVVFVVYCCVARWYKRRERDEPCNERATIEEIYGRHVEHNSIGEFD